MMIAKSIAAIAGGLLRLLVRLQPTRFRDRFGREVLHESLEEIGAAVSDGVRPTLATSTRAITDASRGLVLERFRHLRSVSRKDVFMPRGLTTDLMIASRRIRAQPILTLIVIATLGLAVGAATAIFSVADAVLLRQLPYPESDRLVLLDEQTATGRYRGVSFPAVDIWSREVTSLDSVAFFEQHASLVLVDGEPERLSGSSASRNFHEVLGVWPALGAAFTPGPLVGGPDEVILSHALWLRLGGHSGVIGRSLYVDPRQYRIVGVMPAGFAYPVEAEYWTTPPKSMEMLLTARNVQFLTAVGRLRRGATIDGLRSELAVLTSRYPATDRVGGPVSMTGEGLRESMVGHLRHGITTVGGSAALLLFIAVCNVTALLLGRATTRQREMAMQSALGAARGRLIRQSLFEVLMLAIPGGIAGIAAAWACRDLIVALSLDEVPRIAGVTIDARALGFATMATLGSAALATLLPARLASGAVAISRLQASSRSESGSPGVLRWLQGLVIGQVAVTVVILVAGVLLARSLGRLAAVDTGFSAPNVIAMRVDLPLRPSPPPAVRLAFHEDVMNRVRALPGVESGAFGSRLPLADANASVETQAVGDAREIRSIFQSAGPGFFSTIGATIVQGREIAPDDAKRGPVVVINDVLARHLFGDSPAVGRRVRVAYMTGPLEAEVVGVVRALRYNGLTGAIAPEGYIDYRAVRLPSILFARSSAPAASIVPAIRAAVRESDPTGRATVDQITTLEREVARRLARPRFLMALVGTFAAVALVLATAGLFGVMSFAVAQRRHEMGVRLALGASPSRLFREVVGRGARLISIGLAIGVPTAAAGVRYIRTLLFGVGPWDATTFAGAVGVVCAVSLLACWIPARRAQGTDPLDVLRIS